MQLTSNRLFGQVGDHVLQILVSLTQLWRHLCSDIAPKVLKPYGVTDGKKGLLLVQLFLGFLGGGRLVLVADAHHLVGLFKFTFHAFELFVLAAAEDLFNLNGVI